MFEELGLRPFGSLVRSLFLAGILSRGARESSECAGIHFVTREGRSQMFWLVTTPALWAATMIRDLMRVHSMYVEFMTFGGHAPAGFLASFGPDGMVRTIRP